MISVKKYVLLLQNVFNIHDLSISIETYMGFFRTADVSSYYSSFFPLSYEQIWLASFTTCPITALYEFGDIITT